MKNNVTIAPQTGNTAPLFQAWRSTHLGGLRDFIAFMTTPSGERSRFLLDQQVTGAISGTLMLNTITVNNA